MEEGLATSVATASCTLLALMGSMAMEGLAKLMVLVSELNLACELAMYCWCCAMISLAGTKDSVYPSPRYRTANAINNKIMLKNIISIMDYYKKFFV